MDQWKTSDVKFGFYKEREVYCKKLEQRGDQTHARASMVYQAAALPYGGLGTKKLPVGRLVVFFQNLTPEVLKKSPEAPRQNQFVRRLGF